MGKRLRFENGDVVDADDAPDCFDRVVYDVDYEFDELAGEITTLSLETVPDGQSVQVKYERKTRGEYESPTFSGDPESLEVPTVPGVTTDQAAQQVAITLVSQLSSPPSTASARTPTGSRSSGR
jgi:hypothetical protein